MIELKDLDKFVYKNHTVKRNSNEWFLYLPTHQWPTRTFKSIEEVVQYLESL